MEQKKSKFPSCGETVGLFILSIALYCLAIALDKTPVPPESLVAMGLPPDHVLSFSEKAIGMQMMLVEIIFAILFIAATALRTVVASIKQKREDHMGKKKFYFFKSVVKIKYAVERKLR